MENSRRIDRFALIIVTLIDALMLIGYTIAFTEGELTKSFIVSFDAAVIIALIIIFVSYKKAPNKFRIISLVCYSLIYAQAVIRANNDLAFAIVFPISVVFILYYDARLIKVMSSVFIALNVIDACMQIFVTHATHSGHELKSATIMLQVLSVTVYLIALCIVTTISNQNNSEKINRVKSMADRVTGGIDDINKQLLDLNESSKVMKNSMQNLNSGVADTAEAVQNQLYQTEEIQNKIETLQNATEQISAKVNETMNSVSQGNSNVEELVRSSERSVEISGQVTDKLQDLQESLSQMDEITKLIDSIAFQTNIMALNANVEAARAGEAGRGFAVVASEISNMSDKTKAATEDIEALIENVSSSLHDLTASIKEMSDNISAEKECTDATANVFTEIEGNTSAMRDHAEMLLQNMTNLTEANRGIVSSVQTISATSQEVTALTNEALDIEVKNGTALQQIAEMVSDLAN